MPTHIFTAMPVPLIIAYSLSFIVILIGSLTDLKTREVPDFVNYGFIISGVALNLLLSFVYSDLSFIVHSIVGLMIFFGIAYVMFYTGQWGGGDSKLLMGLGAMIGIDVLFRQPQFLLDFFINALLIGAIYGLLWSAMLMLKNRKRFCREFKKILSESRVVKLKKIVLAVMLIIFVSLFLIYEKKKFDKFFFFIVLSLGFLILTTFYLWIFVKSIEKSSMYKLVMPDKLTEGDWIVNDIYVGKEYICGPKDLGIGKKQIKKLIQFYRHGKVKKILIKEGIPFVPSFLIAFVATLAFGNPMLWMMM